MLFEMNVDYVLFLCLTSKRVSLLGSYPGELEMAGPRHGSRPPRSDYLDDPMPKMRRMDDDRPAMMRSSPDYDQGNRRPNYMEEEQDRFQSDRRAGLMMGGQRRPEDRDDRQRKVVSIFDINDRLRREDVEDRMGGGGKRSGPERFGGRRDEDEDMMGMQRGRPLLRGSAEPRMGNWNDNRTSEREQPGPYDHHMQDERRMPPKNRPVPSILDQMDSGSHEFGGDRRQQRMDPGMTRDQGPKNLGRDRPRPLMQDDFQQSPYYQDEPGNMPAGRPSAAEPSYSRDRDDRNSWSSERSDRFGKFESEGSQSTPRQSNQPSQSSEQSDPVSLLLNLSQLLA